MKTNKNQPKNKGQKAREDQDENVNADINEPGRFGYNYGDDAIEIEMGEGEKIVYGSTFSPQDGDLGDESEDTRDLPKEMRKGGNRYDPTLSAGSLNEADKDEASEIERGLHLSDEDHIGMAYGRDKYVDDDDENKDSIH